MMPRLLMITLALVACAASALAARKGQEVLSLRAFDAATVARTGARCLDGSPSGYYFRKGTGSGETSWVVYMQGGGSCNTEAACRARALTPLGSSRMWQPTYSPTSGNLLDGNAGGNPDFFNWNHLYLPYCDGSVHTGTQRVANEWGLFFAGHNTAIAAVEDARDNLGMFNATEVLISGASAGGIGAFVNADFIADLLPGATVKASPQAGWYYPDGFDDYPDWVEGRTTPTRNGSGVWDRYVSPECARDHPGDRIIECYSISTLYEYIRTPIFMVNNMFDSEQLFGQLGAPNNEEPLTLEYIEYYGDAFRASLDRVVASPKDDGVFAMSCLDHTGFTTSLEGVVISDLRYGETLADWFFERNALPHQLIDARCDSGLPCNPTPGCTNRSPPLF